MQTHLWEQHPDQTEIFTHSGKRKSILTKFPKAGLLILGCTLIFLEFFPVQVISKTYSGNYRTSNLVHVINNLELSNGEWNFTFRGENFSAIPINLISLLISRGKKTHNFFPEDSGFLSKVWSVIWRIPWNAKFGILLEWVPLFISLGWLFIWYLIMVVLIRRSMAMGDEEADTFFIQFSRFAQVFYLFCIIQAIF